MTPEIADILNHLSSTIIRLNERICKLEEEVNQLKKLKSTDYSDQSAVLRSEE